MIAIKMIIATILYVFTCIPGHELWGEHVWGMFCLDCPGQGSFHLSNNAESSGQHDYISYTQQASKQMKQYFFCIRQMSLGCVVSIIYLTCLELFLLELQRLSSPFTIKSDNIYALLKKCQYFWKLATLTKWLVSCDFIS